MVPSVTEVLDRFKTDWIQQLQPAAIEPSYPTAKVVAVHSFRIEVWGLA